MTRISSSALKIQNLYGVKKEFPLPVPSLSEPTKDWDSTISRGSFLPKEFDNIWVFLVLFLSDYLSNQIFGFVSELKP